MRFLFRQASGLDGLRLARDKPASGPLYDSNLWITTRDKPGTFGGSASEARNSIGVHSAVAGANHRGYTFPTGAR